MAKVELLAPFILKWEGGFVNDPADAGGATNKGITIATWKANGRDIDGDGDIDTDDLKKISVSDFNRILKSLYWDKWRADEINSQPVANLLVGWAWGSGPATSIKEFQKLAGLTPDGVVGPKTLSLINSSEPVALFDKIWLARKNFFIDIVAKKPNQIKFLPGWLNRLYDNVPYNFNRTLK
jgi:lysozyme family protein